MRQRAKQVPGAMFQHRRQGGAIIGALTLFELIFHAAVHSIRKTHNNAFTAIAMNMLQVVVFVMAFYIMFSVLGMRGIAVRGDFMIYLMSGVFLFLTHNKALGAVMGAEGPASAMMKHAPMNTTVAIASAALGALYIQVLSLVVILFLYHVISTPVVIDRPIPAFGMVLVAWITGVSIGLVLLALKPWAPTLVNLISTIYQRANMIASGKMFLANTLPPMMLAMFDWNPLFHSIDQARGFAFINYNPFNSSWEYPLKLALILLAVGLMGEFYTRRHASISWSAGK
jgi:ABC-type polysaccharide/polyol phosphate export permease